ncbi:hypothetical protein [Nonomuraea sp. NPDC046570]|uniref:hypothetical protein n=1 Tax=Nonomuraea sp. NPDC046570 TaxID=3155255 RepID=UPI0033FF46D1
MRVGCGTAALAVPEGTPMGGYIDRPGPAAGVLDGLRVSAITWYDGRRRFALAVADVICVNDDLAEWARQALAPLCELWLTATHTHAGPETGCVPGGAATPPPWGELIVEAVRNAVERAIAAETPATTGTVHRGMLRGVGADRSRPSAEPVVPLDLLAVHDAHGHLTGVLAVLPVHPTVLPPANVKVSADLTGAVREALSERLGPGVWVVVATGAAGDISTRHTRQGQDAAELARLGALVATRCTTLLSEETPAALAWSDGSRVGWTEATVALDRMRAVGDPEALAGALRVEYERARAAGDAVAAGMARSRLDGARLLTGQDAQGGPISARVAVVRLGELALAALPGEPFLAVGEAVRTARRGPTVVLGYANGYPGYLPTADAYDRTEYEVLATQVARGGAEKLAATARHLLHTLDTEENS